jgi:hypothetical protein
MLRYVLVALKAATDPGFLLSYSCGVLDWSGVCVILSECVAHGMQLAGQPGPSRRMTRPRHNLTNPGHWYNAVGTYCNALAVSAMP